MKKVIVASLFLCILLTSCGGWKNVTPAGKTENDWTSDELYCREKSGKITGVFAVSSYGTYVNQVKGANDIYNQCLEEKGWIEKRKWFYEYF